MASSSPHHLFLFALAFLAIAAPCVDAWGGRLFFSKMTRPKAAATTDTTVLPEAFDTNSVPAFSRPSTSARSNRGYGLYGRPEEHYPPAYFRSGVHRDAEKLTTTTTDNDVPMESEEATPAVRPVEEESSRKRAEPWSAFPENGSGRGRPLTYARTHGQGRQNYGMSDTRLYENGRYYYDVETDKYGYESNPVRTRPEEFGFGGGERRANAAGYETGSGHEFGNGVVEKQNGFEENQNEQYIP